MFAVTAEQLVRPHPREQDLHPGGARRFRHKERIDGRGIAGRLVEDVDHTWKELDDIWLDLNLVQIDVVEPGDLSGVERIIWHGFESMVLGSERDRVRVYLGIVTLRQHSHNARVEPAGKKTRHRNIRDQVRGDEASMTSRRS